jgi:outer membrane receptor protein involved in Fe transport
MRDSAALRPTLAVLLAAALVPATLLGQTANPPPTPPDQTVAPANQPPVPVATTPAPAANAGETVVLSPFEVNAQQAQGYFTPNTTTGTRLANNIGDIPSSVTVIDRQQLDNTNSQNINDIMMYEAGTQGSRTYTQATGFSESTRIDDVLAGTNDTQTAIGGLNTNTTRINSLGLPDNEVDNFYGLYRIPFDTYNVQSIEIDRGPNSLMFGSGSAAGIVNASSNEAQIDKLSGDVSFQGSSFGGYRETADINIPLIRNKVAVYLAQVYNSVGMQRQPSSDLTRRQYATITIDPFKSHKTKLTAYAEFYNNYARDENSLLPTDEITPWLAAGRPVFNPVTQMITDLGTGKVLGPYVSSTTSPGYVAGYPTGTGGFGAFSTPLYQQAIGASSNHFTEVFGLNGQYLYGFNPQQNLGSNYGGLIPVQVPTSPLTASQAMVRSEFMTNSGTLPGPGPGTPGTPVFYVNGVEEGGYASWITPGIVDQSIYNAQTGPNYYGTDYTVSKARTYHMDFQQNILSSSRWGSLDLDIGFLRQEYHDSEVTPDNQHGNDAIFIDTNSFLLNGQPNAYAGSVLFYDYQGDAFQAPENDQNWRGMLTYAIDLRDKLPKWLQFLGHHRFMAEASTHDDVKQDIRFRTVINGGDGSYTSELYQLNNQPVIPGNYNIDGEGTDPYRWQYFSAPGSHVMDQPPSLYGIPGFGSQPTSITATTYNYYTGQWVNSGLTVASPAFNGYQITENVQDQKTYYWQSFFWNDRIIGSLGLNDDVVKNRSGGTVFNAIINGVPTATTNNAGLVSYINGVENPALKYLVGPWNPTTIAGQYATGTSQLLLQSLGEIGGNTYSEGFVVRPFENWSFIDSAANNGNIIAGVLRTLGMTFNKADNFNPPAGTYTDLLGNPLGKPTGQEKDYGLEIATPDKKLYLRMTWFKSANQNNTSGVSQTLTTREVYIDQNDMRQWAADVVALESGENPTSTQFGNQSIYPLSTAQYATMAQLTGLNQNYLEGAGGNDVTGGYSNSEATNTYSAAGYDLEVTYNPVPNWTLKFTGSRQIGQLSAVDLQAKAYQAVRMPIWTTASAPAAYQTVYTNYLGNGSTATANFSTFWTGWGFGSDTSATGGPGGGPQTVSNYYNTVVTIPITVEEAAQGQDVPEETEYTWNFLTNYQFTSGILRNLGVGGGLRWLSSTIEGYYGATQTSLLNGSYQVAVGDLSKPIYNPAQLHADAWISYGFKLPFDDGKIKCTVQLNCVDLTSNGYIQAIQYNLDGSPAVYRVFPPRQFSLTTRFSF